MGKPKKRGALWVLLSVAVLVILYGVVLIMPPVQRYVVPLIAIGALAAHDKVSVNQIQIHEIDSAGSLYPHRTDWFVLYRIEKPLAMRGSILVLDDTMYQNITYDYFRPIPRRKTRTPIQFG